MLGDQFGIGVDYIQNSVEYSSTDKFGNDTDFKMVRQRIHLRFNYHFGNTDHLDLYAGLGVGTNTRTFDWKVNDTEFLGGDRGSLLKVSARLCFGVRYYFTENIGIMTEIGLGGPVISVGPSIKF